MPQQPFKLIPFNKDRQAPAGQILVAGNIRRSADVLDIEYDVTDSFYEVQWPNPVAKPMRKDELWQHTCFELFIAPWGVNGYWEFNIAPNSDWNCYRFSDYRENQKPEFNIQAIDCVLHDSDTMHKHLSVSIPLFKELRNTTWSVGICAVIRDKNQQLHYYALAHCGKQPDFHLRNSFMLTLTNDKQ